MARRKKGTAAAALFSPFMVSTPKAVGLKSLKRRCGGLLEWGIELLHSGERFPRACCGYPRLSFESVRDEALPAA